MAFVAGLRESLQNRQTQAAIEVTNGASLEQVLSRDLVAVEAMADGELITSILLLSDDGTRLTHGAAPNLPQSYRQAIDGSPIGPSAGSCGTAAYLCRPIYVSDIRIDPLWADYKHFALPHGLRSCWSTPICAPDGKVLGTFAIYRRTVGHPAQEEIDAIAMITEHAAEAILSAGEAANVQQSSQRSNLKLVIDNGRATQPEEALARLLQLAAKLDSKATELEALAESSKREEVADTLRATADHGRTLAASLRRGADRLGDGSA